MPFFSIACSSVHMNLGGENTGRVWGTKLTDEGQNDVSDSIPLEPSHSCLSGLKSDTTLLTNSNFCYEVLAETIDFLVVFIRKMKQISYKNLCSK